MNYMKIKNENDRIFENGSFPDMRSEYYRDFDADSVKAENKLEYKVAEHTQSLTTIACILKNAGRKTAALNFANANFPGGAYIMGGNAQEESLCRCSLLYYTIKDCTEYYNANHKHITPDYTDGIIWSENVPVIRDDSGELLETPVLCDFMTCPAVNRRLAFAMGDKRIDSIMERRIEKITALALSKKPEVIVFGAFGCGVFGNKREKVFPMFERAINKFSDGNTEIIFAIP